jgi:hypothetical protein
MQHQHVLEIMMCIHIYFIYNSTWTLPIFLGNFASESSQKLHFRHPSLLGPVYFISLEIQTYWIFGIRFKILSYRKVISCNLCILGDNALLALKSRLTYYFGRSNVNRLCMISHIKYLDPQHDEMFSLNENDKKEEWI